MRQLENNEIDIDMMRMDHDKFKKSDITPSETPDYGKGKISQFLDSIFGWSPKKFYNEKIKEPIKSRLPNWSPSNFYNEKIKKPVKESQIFKSIFNDLNE